MLITKNKILIYELNFALILSGILLSIEGFDDVCLLRQPSSPPLEVRHSAHVGDEIQTSQGGGRSAPEASQGDEKDWKISECL